MPKNTNIRYIFASLLAVFGLIFTSNAYAQESSETIETVANIEQSEASIVQSEYTVINNYENEITDPRIVTKRVWTDIGFSILYGLVADSVVIGSAALINSDASAISAMTIIALSNAVMPALAVKTSESIWGGMGSMGWTLGGSVLGAIGGAAIGASSFIVCSNGWDVLTGIMITYVFSAVGAIVGGIVAYEITDTKNAEAKQYAITNIHPVIELNEERKVFGMGFSF